MGQERRPEIKGSCITLDSALTSFFSSEKFSSYREDTKVAYRTDVDQFGNFLKENRVDNFSQLDYGHIIGFLGQFAQKTASRKLSVIKTFLEYSGAPTIIEGILRENLPRRSAKLEALNSLNPQQCQKLLEIAKAKSARDTALITILLATGAGITEALKLRPEDFQKVSSQRISIRFKS